MKTFVCVACAVVVVALFIAVRNVNAAGCCGATVDTKAVPNGEGDAIAQKLCPVMGNAINPKIFVDYKGRRVYFCCGMCPNVFNKDPEKYIKSLDEQLKGTTDAKPKA